MLLKAFSFLYQYLLLSVLIKSTLGDSGIARILPQEYVKKHDQAVSRYIQIVTRYSSVVFPGSASGKELSYQCRRHKSHGFNPWARKISWRKAWQPTPVFLPGKSHGQRSLIGYSPQGCKKSEMTEAAKHACTRVVKPINGVTSKSGQLQDKN